MHGDSIFFTIFLIFTGGAIVAGLALFARQSMLVAYIALGVLVGPWGIGLIEDATTAQGIGEIGIIFLLYLLGLNLHPQKLARMIREATVVTVGSSLAFAGAGAAVALAFDFTLPEVLVIGALSMFSSTIIGLKLLPTTTLHHRHAGEVIISVLLLQDVIAIVLLLGLDAASRPTLSAADAVRLAAALPVVVVVSAAMERWVLTPLIRRFDTIREYIFLVAIGWCLGVSQLGYAMGLSHEIGAFIAGVALARSPVATYIAESLKPLRDFFLVMFFFALGAGFPIPVLAEGRSPRGVSGRPDAAVETGGLSMAAAARTGVDSPFEGDRCTAGTTQRILPADCSHRVGRRRHRPECRLYHPRGHALHVHRVELRDHAALSDPDRGHGRPAAGLRHARQGPSCDASPSPVR